MVYYTQEKSELILVSIDKLFSDVECAIFFVDFHLLMQNPGIEEIIFSENINRK